MNSDVMHSRVQDGPQVHQPKANQQTVGATSQIFEKGVGRTQLEPTILRQLVAEVKETVATDVEYNTKSKRSFGVVGLWNIRRNSRYAAHSRHKKPTIVTGLRG